MNKLSIKASEKSERRLTILLAEDDPDDQELIADAFSAVDASLDLHLVNNGKSVLQYLEDVPDRELPCLIVLDYNMPELTGAEVLEKICKDERYASIPKIVLSTSNNSKHIEECISNGAHAYRVKPSNFSQLMGIAREMLDMCKSAA